MESGVKAVVKVIEGAGGLPWISELRGLEHREWQDGAELTRDCWLVLNARGEALQEMLGPCIRHRCSFVTLGLDALGEEGARRLCRTGARRKFRGVVLGGWRLYPLVSASKEVVAGGCLGTLQSVELAYGGKDGWENRVLADDVAQWIGKAENTAVIRPSEEQGLSLSVTGTLGTLRGWTDWEGCGWLKSMLGDHERQRKFTFRVDVRRMEMNVLRCIGGLSGELPCLLSCHGLSQLLEGATTAAGRQNGEEKVSITDNKS